MSVWLSGWCSCHKRIGELPVETVDQFKDLLADAYARDGDAFAWRWPTHPPKDTCDGAGFAVHDWYDRIPSDSWGPDIKAWLRTQPQQHIGGVTVPDADDGDVLVNAQVQLYNVPLGPLVRWNLSRQDAKGAVWSGVTLQTREYDERTRTLAHAFIALRNPDLHLELAEALSDQMVWPASVVNDVLAAFVDAHRDL